MLYIEKGVDNTLVLNINNNSRDTFTGYTLLFTHIMSKEEKTYSIDISNSSEFFDLQYKAMSTVYLSMSGKSVKSQ